MPNVSITTCCGVLEIDGVQDFKSPRRWAKREFFVELREELYGISHTRDWHWPTVLIFTDAKRPCFRTKTAGDQFAAWIASNDLGEVTSTSWKKNHNTDNNIKVWMWHPKTDACDELANNYLRELEQAGRA